MQRRNGPWMARLSAMMLRHISYSHAYKSIWVILMHDFSWDIAYFDRNTHILVGNESNGRVPIKIECLLMSHKNIYLKEDSLSICIYTLAFCIILSCGNTETDSKNTANAQRTRAWCVMGWTSMARIMHGTTYEIWDRNVITIIDRHHFW